MVQDKHAKTSKEAASPLKDIFKAKYSQELSLKLIFLFLSNHWPGITSLIPSVIIGSGMFLEGSRTLLVTLLGAEARLGEARHQQSAFEGIFLPPTPFSLSCSLATRGKQLGSTTLSAMIFSLVSSWEQWSQAIKLRNPKPKEAFLLSSCFAQDFVTDRETQQASNPLLFLPLPQNR